MAPAEREALREGLRRAAAGSWTIKFKCTHATKCGCPCTVEFKHLPGTGTCTVTQTDAHQLHDPSSEADLAQLRMHPVLEAKAKLLLRAGVKPEQVLVELNSETILAQPAAGSSGLGMKQRAAAADRFIAITQVYALQKRLAREMGFGLTSDVAAIAALAAELQPAGCMPWYRPYRKAGSGTPGQALACVIQTPFQARMMDQFGRRKIGLDATFGTNRYGYPLYALTVRLGAAAMAWPADVLTTAALLRRHPTACIHAHLAGRGRRGTRRARGLLHHQQRHRGGCGRVPAQCTGRGECRGGRGAGPQPGGPGQA